MAGKVPFVVYVFLYRKGLCEVEQAPITIHEQPIKILQSSPPKTNYQPRCMTLPSILLTVSFVVSKTIGRAGRYRLIRDGSAMVSKFDPHYANQLRKRHGKPGDTWYMDEITIIIVQVERRISGTR